MEYPPSPWELMLMKEYGYTPSNFFGKVRITRGLCSLHFLAYHTAYYLKHFLQTELPWSDVYSNTNKIEEGRQNLMYFKKYLAPYIKK